MRKLRAMFLTAVVPLGSPHRVASIATAAAPATTGAADEGSAIEMHLLTSGANQKLRYYIPQRLNLTAERPPQLHRAAAI